MDQLVSVHIINDEDPDAIIEHNPLLLIKANANLDMKHKTRSNFTIQVVNCLCWVVIFFSDQTF